jgi:hypothetical protein
MQDVLTSHGDHSTVLTAVGSLENCEVTLEPQE